MERVRLPGADVFGRSQTLWSKLLDDQIFSYKDRGKGWGVYDDFTNFSVTTALSSGVTYYMSEGNAYRSYEKSNNSTSTANIAKSDTVYTVPTGFPIYSPNAQNTLFAAGTLIPTPGQVNIGSATSSLNVADRAFLQMAPISSSANTCPFQPYLATSQLPSITCFECRLFFNSIDTNLGAFFIGLAASGASQATNPLDGSSPPVFSTTPDLLGFGYRSASTRYNLEVVYDKASGTVQESSLLDMSTYQIYGNNVFGSTSNKTAGVYVKLGFVHSTYGTGTFTPYVNGIPFDGVVAPNKVITGCNSKTNWPANPMTLCAAMCQVSTATNAGFTLDWWAAAQTQG